MNNEPIFEPCTDQLTNPNALVPEDLKAVRCKECRALIPVFAVIKSPIDGTPWCGRCAEEKFKESVFPLLTDDQMEEVWEKIMMHVRNLHRWRAEIGELAAYLVAHRRISIADIAVAVANKEKRNELL